MTTPFYYRSAATKTTAQAFEEFRFSKVDLLAESVAKARRSRDHLQVQIANVAKNTPNFPPLAGGYIAFGSFARSTKVRPLDDIDMLTLVNGRDTVAVQDYSATNRFGLKIRSQQAPLAAFADKDGYINSTLILNRLRNGLQGVTNYSKSEIKRNNVAVVLNLSSYSWVFDIVPALSVGNSEETTHYLIPDGDGAWMRTDPRKDQTLVSQVNQMHNGYLLPLIRLIKYWNQYSKAAPRLASYYLETMLLYYFRYHNPPLSALIRTHVPVAFYALAQMIIGSCPDPKGLGQNLDASMSWEDRYKIRDAANERAKRAEAAIAAENRGNHAEAISRWASVFPNFS